MANTVKHKKQDFLPLKFLTLSKFGKIIGQPLEVISIRSSIFSDNATFHTSTHVWLSKFEPFSIETVFSILRKWIIPISKTF